MEFSIISLIVSSLLPVGFAVFKTIKKFKSSKCTSKCNIKTEDGHEHVIELNINKSIRNLEEMVKELKIKVNDNNTDIK